MKKYIMHFHPKNFFTIFNLLVLSLSTALHLALHHLHVVLPMLLPSLDLTRPAMPFARRIFSLAQ